MDNKRLICVIMGQNCEKFLPMCLESLKDADAIVYCDGGSTDKTISYLIEKGFHRRNNHKGEPIEFREGWLQKWIIRQEYNQEDKAMNGKQRNFYLNYLKQNYPNDWVLVLDADEVVDDLNKIKAFIQEAQDGVYNIKMRHFIGNLGQEDATTNEHFAMGRLFKISEVLKYPEVEHPVIIPKDNTFVGILRQTIWHLGYISGIFDVKKKYENHLKKSNMHTPQYLYNWKLAHMLGKYPTKPVNILDIPRIILDYFGIEKDIFYFGNRGLNTNQFIMARDWYNHYNPHKILDLGCGLGNFGLIFRDWYNVEYKGVELSEWAVNLNPYKLNIVQGDITSFKEKERYDLVLVLDVLEHLDEQELDKALDNIKNFGNYFIFSIPFLGDPNLQADQTHKIHKSKDWWIEKLSTIYNVENSPATWAFSPQILIGRTK